MPFEDFILFASAPAGADGLDILEKASEEAEPMLDLRYGDDNLVGRLLSDAVARGLPGLTVLVDESHAIAGGLVDALPPGTRAIISHRGNAGSGRRALSHKLCSRGIEVGIEVVDAESARLAEGNGASFLLVSGNEAYGPVSDRMTLVLLQEVLAATNLPVVVRGSLGPLGAAAAAAMGCQGCVLDSQLLLVDESPLSRQTKDALLRVSCSDTIVVGTLAGKPYRCARVGDRRKLDEVLAAERAILEGDSILFDSLIARIMSGGTSGSTTLMPVGQGIEFARQFATKGMSLIQVLAAYRAALRGVVSGDEFAFGAGSALATAHGTRYPVVQGPMAFVSTNAKFCRAVAEAGALPFFAAGGLSREETADMLADARDQLDGLPFGIGIIGFAPSAELSGQIEDILASGPAVLTIAGGSPELAGRFEARGASVYLHAPTLSHIRNHIDGGVSGLIFEGREAGGHVGAIGSMILWELGAAEIAGRGEDAAGMRVLFAGGIAGQLASVAAAEFARPLTKFGVKVGLQLGTAYLATDDAVESGAVPEHFRDALREGGDTVVVGSTVNLPARWLKSDESISMLRHELDLLSGGEGLAERKQVVEGENHDHVRASLLSVAADNTAYLCGQGISVRQSMTMNDLHEAITTVAAGHTTLSDTGVGSCPPGDDEIAIVGMGCVLPGAPSVDQYWANIVNRVSMVKEIPKWLWDTDLYYDSSGDDPAKSYTKLGTFLEGFEKDPIKFRIPPKVAESIDDLQFVMLEAVHQALSDAGYIGRKYSHNRTGVFIGASRSGASEMGLICRIFWPETEAAIRATPHFQSLPASEQEALLSEVEHEYKKSLPTPNADSLPGILRSVVAGRVANRFDMKGMSSVTDSACASALAALDLAVGALRDRRVDMAVCGGADMNADQLTYTLFCRMGALSAKGSFPFDERADGFILGQGGAAVALKRLGDARRDGDRIYAVVRGVGTSTDGGSKGIAAPDVYGQIAAMRRCYEAVDFSPASVSLLEAHGTGTWAGDTAELESTRTFFEAHGARAHSIGMGSVKSSIGHLKAGAGIASLVKAARALHEKVLPPTINCEQPRKDVDWASSPMYLLTEAKQWETNGVPRRAGVSAFGFGGVNYHVALEEAPDNLEQDEQALPAELAVFRAGSRTELLDMVGDTLSELSGTRCRSLQEIARCSHRNMSSSGPTLAIVAGSIEMLHANLERAQEVIRDESRSDHSLTRGVYFRDRSLAEGEKIGFLFPGQGSQYLNMLGDLADHLEFVDGILRQVDGRASQDGQSLAPILIADPEMDDDEKERLTESMVNPRVNHGMMLVLSRTLIEALRRAGIEPEAVAGHSAGEWMAVHAAGVLDQDAIVDLTARRGASMKARARIGGMAAIACSLETVQPYLDSDPGYVVAANINSPSQVVISGDENAIERVMAAVGEQRIMCSRLRVLGAFHTKYGEPCVEAMRQGLEGVQIRMPKMPVQSNAAGTAYDSSHEDFPALVRDLLCKHMTHPVQFVSNIESMYDEGVRLFIEVGSGYTLSSFVDKILVDRPHWAVPTNISRRSAVLQLTHALAVCAVHGKAINMDAMLGLSAPGMKRRRRKRGITPVSPPAASVSAPVASEPTTSGVDAVRPTAGDQEVMELLVKLVAAKTGYPEDVIDVDLDVEAELGIDSIQQVEIIREAAETIGVDLGSDTRSAKYSISTLRSLGQLLCESMSESNAGHDVGSIASAPVRSGGEMSTDCRSWVCSPVALDLQGTTDESRLEGRTILVLGEAEGLTSRIDELAASKGAQVSVTSLDGDGPVIPQDIHYVINVSSVGEDQVPSADELDDWWKKISARAVGQFAVASALKASILADPGTERHWVEVTTLGGRLGDGEISTVPCSAGIGLGLSRCMRGEVDRGYSARHIDFPPGYDRDEIAQRVIAELLHDQGCSEIGYVDNRRHELRWQSEELVLSDGPLAGLSSDTVVLAIGGAKGIGSNICTAIARRSGCRFILVGRSTVDDSVDDEMTTISFDDARDELLRERRADGVRVVPSDLEKEAWSLVWDRERRANIRRIREAASGVEYRQCDVTDVKQVQALADHVKKAYGRVDVLVNGSGELVTKSLDDSSVDEIVAGMRIKAFGTASLLAGLSGIEVGSFVNLSSIAGRWGGAGQATYAAAHEVAAVLVAGMRGGRPGKWTSIYYGPWLNLGMTRIGPVMERLVERGATFVTEEDGSRALMSELVSGTGRSVGYCGREALGDTVARTESTLLDDLVILDDGGAKATKTFDPVQHAYVGEHRVEFDTPIVPGAISLEFMAQTAATVCDPGDELVEVTDLVFERAARFPRMEPRTFHARVTPVDDPGEGHLFNGEVFSLSTLSDSVDARKAVHASCRLRMGVRRAPVAPRIILAERGLSDNMVSVDDLWGEGPLAHRIGMYRNIFTAGSVTRRGLLAELDPVFPAGIGERAVSRNPILIDGLFAVPVFQSVVFGRSAVQFIGGVERIEFFDAEGCSDRRTATCRMIETETEYATYDAEALDDSGRVLERITNGRKVFARPGDSAGPVLPGWKEIEHDSLFERVCTSLGVGGMATSSHVSIHHAAAADDEVLKEWLSPAEMDHYWSLVHEKRRYDWLAGRIAAKGAIAQLMDVESLEPSAYTIASGKDAPPVVSVDGKDQPLNVSISHSGTTAVATAAHERGIGVDVQEIADSILEIRDRFCDADEVQTMAAVTGATEKETLTDIWAVKEAVFKARGTSDRNTATCLESAVEEDGFALCRLRCADEGGVATAAVYRCDGYSYAVARVVTVSSADTIESSNTTSRLLGVWEDILKIGPLKPTDDFFALGGDSMAAVHIFERVAAEFGVLFPADVMFDAPTVADLADKIDEGTRYDSSVIPMRRDGAKLPLFLVHGLGGGMIRFRDLCERLDGSRPVFGIRLLTEQLDPAGPITLRTLAERYVSDILEVQPEGPFSLAGYSLGSQIAFEIAGLLGAQGHKVQFLGVLDGLMAGSEPSLDMIWPWIMNLPHGLGEFVGESVSHRFSRLKRKARAAVSPSTDEQKLMAMLERLLGEDAMASYSDSQMEVHRKVLLAWADYRAEPYDGDLVLFKARKQPVSRLLPDALGWREVVKGNVDVHVVDGNHATMMIEPAVKSLGSVINSALAELR